MEKPEGYGGETLPGVSEKGRGGTDQSLGGGMGAESTGPWAPEACTRESARLMERTPRPQAQTPRAVGQQKLKSCALHGCGAHSYRVLGTDRASEGPRGPGVEEDGVWEPSPGALAGGGGGCSCMRSRSVIRAW